MSIHILFQALSISTLTPRALVLSEGHLWIRKSSGHAYWRPILEAADRVPVGSVVAIQVGVTGIEVQVASIAATHRTRPVVAVGPDIVKRTGAVVAVARSWQ